jgi:NADPH:quinone reductase-like Zn-dependent oxidoreductase
MRAAGVRTLGGPIEALELPAPRPLAPGEVLIDVNAAGAGNWDPIVAAGDWDVGIRPPMALGVEAAGRIAAVGDGVADWAVGDEVMTHPLPLREQGAWAEQLIAPADLLARKPAGTAWEEAAAFPVPALTAEQTLTEALAVTEAEWLLVHGGGSGTGGIMIGLGAARGARVIATAGPRSAERVRALGAHEVLDYHDEGWPARVRELAGGRGVDAAANAVIGGEADALRAVRDGGRLATITGAPPPAERGVRVESVYVRPDGDQLRRLSELLAQGRVAMRVGAVFPLAQAADAVEAATAGTAGGAVVIRP